MAPPVDPCEPADQGGAPSDLPPAPLPAEPAPDKAPAPDVPPAPLPADEAPGKLPPAPVDAPDSQTPPAPLPSGRASELPGWEAAAAELRDLGWTEAEVGELADDQLSAEALEAVLEAERARLAVEETGSPEAPKDGESADEAPAGEPLSPEMAQAVQDYHQRYLALGMPEDLAIAYLESGAQTGDPAVIAAAYEQAARNATSFGERGWFDRFEKAGIEPVVAWQAAVGLGMPNPMTGEPMPTGTDAEIRAAYNATVGMTAPMTARLANLGLSLFPGGRAFQYAIGSEPFSKQVIDRSSPLEIGLAVASALALIPAIRGARTLFGRFGARAAIQGALRGVDESRVVRGALQAAEAQGIKVGGGAIIGRRARIAAGIAYARDVERTWLGGGRNSVLARIAQLTDEAVAARAAGAADDVVKGFDDSISALNADVKAMDGLLDDIAQGKLLPRTEKAPWVPRVMGRMRGGRDVVDYAPASFLRSTGMNDTLGVSGKVKAGVESNFVNFSRRLRVGGDADVTTAHAMRAAWQRMLAPEGRMVGADRMAELGIDVSMTGAHVLESVPGFGVGRVGEALGLAERSARLGTGIFQSPIEEAIRASWQVRAGYDALRQGTTHGLHGNVGAARIADYLRLGPASPDPVDPAHAARLGAPVAAAAAPVADDAAATVVRRMAPAFDDAAINVLDDAGQAADDALDGVARAAAYGLDDAAGTNALHSLDEAAAAADEALAAVGDAAAAADDLAHGAHAAGATADDAVVVADDAAAGAGAADELAGEIADRLHGPFARAARLDGRTAIREWLDAHEGYRYVKAHSRRGVWQPATFQARAGYAGLPVKRVDDEMRALIDARPDLVWRPANSQATDGYFAKALGWGERGRAQAFEQAYVEPMRDNANGVLSEVAHKLGIDEPTLLR